VTSRDPSRRPCLVFAALIFLCAGRAHAHGSFAGSFEPLVVAPLLFALWLYVRSFVHLRSLQRVGLGLGMGALFVALISPLGALGETLLSAHMVQHALLVAVAPPLLLLGHPAALFVRGLPLRWRPAWAGAARVFSMLSRPLPAAALHGFTLWFWHAPAAFDAALESAPLHLVEHASFFGTALLFWTAVMRMRGVHRSAAALAAAFATLVHSGLLGALITLSPYPLYRGASLEEQQLAGLIMWVPMGVAYLAACLYLASRLVAGAGLRAP
jgi:putative membrane protein